MLRDRSFLHHVRRSRPGQLALLLAFAMVTLPGCSDSADSRPVEEPPNAPSPSSAATVPTSAPENPSDPDAVPGAILGHVSCAQGPAFEYVAQVMPVDISGEHLTAITDAEGNFIIEEVPPGTYFMTVSDLYAFKTGWIRQRATRVTVGSGEVVTRDFAFDTGVSVRGTIAGMPIIENRVQVQLLREGAPRLTGTPIGDQQQQVALATYLEGTTYAKPDGSFELLDVRPGTYEIRIRTYPESTVDRSLPWAPPEHTSPVTVGESDVTLELTAE